MRKRKRNKRSIQIVIGSGLCFLLAMTAGYAAFSTNLTLNAKGNVHNMTTVDKLKNNAVTSGDGLYIDVYEDGRYVYKGEDPNNYLNFSGNLYRIMSFEKDGTTKIIKNTTISAGRFDNYDNRYSENSYCSGTYNDSYCGCNLWGSNTTMLDSIGNSIKVFPKSFGSTETLSIPDKEASINTYLNTTFYNSLDDEKKYIVNHKFNVGKMSRGTITIKEAISQENAQQWNGKIGLMSVSDYIRGSTNSSCTSPKDNFEGCSGSGCTCTVNNYLYLSSDIRTITPLSWNDPSIYSTDRCVVGMIQHGKGGAIITATANYSQGYEYYPSFYISATKFSGSGTETDPYTIKS